MYTAVRWLRCRDRIGCKLRCYRGLHIFARVLIRAYSPSVQGRMCDDNRQRARHAADTCTAWFASHRPLTILERTNSSRLSPDHTLQLPGIRSSFRLALPSWRHQPALFASCALTWLSVARPLLLSSWSRSMNNVTSTS